MFGKVKKQENQYIIAVKDFDATRKALAEETISLPFEKSLYRDLIATSCKKVDNLKQLNSFIKFERKEKKDVMHYWEDLITDGYTLMDVTYDKKTPSLDRLCDTEKFKFVCMV